MAIINPINSAMGSIKVYHLKVKPKDAVFNIAAPPAKVMLIPAAIVNQFNFPFFNVNPAKDVVSLLFTRNPTIRKLIKEIIITICSVVISIYLGFYFTCPYERQQKFGSFAS